ncbi:tripartite tricarboxylate transporter TctB family protein [Nocardiopsis mangrovi]|uniref:Tripartite tricarboxylate transporter TctB family protein n=1 Tax=Nocardiopsis mangrovi TaxID=1179818 RepID=A0ABV9DQD7_9ACTN
MSGTTAGPEGAPPAAVPWGPRVTALVVLGVGVVVLAGSFLIPEGNTYQAVGASTFPLMVGVGTVLVGAANAVRSWRGGDRGGAERAAEEAAATHWPTVLMLGGAVLGYAALLLPLGFWQTSSAFLVVAARILGSRRPLRDLVIGLVFSLAVYFLFDRLLGVTLPPGIVRLAF